jgi:hypothetical protein
VCPTLFLICRAHVVNGKANVKIARRDDADVKRCSNACGKITGVARAGRCEEVDACGKITGVARAGRDDADVKRWMHVGKSQALLVLAEG